MQVEFRDLLDLYIPVKALEKYGRDYDLSLIKHQSL